MPFFLDGNPTQGEIAEAVNYLLGNFSQNVTADPNTGQITGPTGEINGYLYKYMYVKYADSFDGTLNFSNVPTNRYYYGLRNSDDPAESTNPADYIWYKLDPLTYPSGFGTVNFLYYLTTGGRQIQFVISTAVPNPGWIQDTGAAIDLDVTAKTDAVANFVVIRTPNNSAPPTDAECIANIGRTPISGDLCTVNYNSGIYSIVYKYTTGWAVFQKYITGDLIVAHTITATELSASYVQVGGAAGDVNSGVTTIDGGKITANSITVNEINNVATGQIIAGSFNLQIITSSTTFTVPAYVYKLKITLVGGGGGGGSAPVGSTYSGGGAGGGALRIFSVNPGDVCDITIGNGGSPGNAGSNSIFKINGTTYLTCNGGPAGGASVVNGGSASGGTLNYAGGSSIYDSGGSAPFIGTGAGRGANAVANSGGGGGSGISGILSAGSGGSGVCFIEY